jgi:hypothetical protein
MNKVINELNEKMYAIAEKKSLSPADLKFLEECLYNKWYGVQVVAAKVLAKLHPSEALTLLREWLMSHIKNHSLTRIAQKALLPCITADDLAWIFDLYVKDRSRHLTFLMGALLQFPNQDVIHRLIQDCQTYNSLNSITVLARIPVVDRDRVLQKLLNHPNVGHKDYLQRAFGWGVIPKDQIARFQRFKNPV